jgi:hypothetical protein
MQNVNLKTILSNFVQSHQFNLIGWGSSHICHEIKKQNLNIYIKKNKEIIKSNYFINARGTVWPFNYMKALNQDIGHLDVFGNSYNKNFFYNINVYMMTYMYSVIKRVNNYVSHVNHNDIITV